MSAEETMIVLTLVAGEETVSESQLDCSVVFLVRYSNNCKSVSCYFTCYAQILTGSAATPDVQNVMQKETVKGRVCMDRVVLAVR